MGAISLVFFQELKPELELCLSVKLYRNTNKTFAKVGKDQKRFHKRGIHDGGDF